MGLISVDYGDRGKRGFEQPDSVDCLGREIARWTFFSCSKHTEFNASSGASTAGSSGCAESGGSSRPLARRLPFLNVSLVSLFLLGPKGEHMAIF